MAFALWRRNKYFPSTQGETLKCWLNAGVEVSEIKAVFGGQFLRVDVDRRPNRRNNFSDFSGVVWVRPSL